MRRGLLPALLVLSGFACGTESAENERTGTDCPASIQAKEDANAVGTCAGSPKLVCQYRKGTSCFAFSCAPCNGEGYVRWCATSTINESACNPKEFR